MDGRTACSLCVVVGIAVSQCGASQFSKSTQQDFGDSVRSPLFMTWAGTLWNISLALPALLRLGAARRRSGCRSGCRSTDGGQPREPGGAAGVASDLLLGGELGLAPGQFLRRLFLFYATWLVANYSYQYALTCISVSLVAALFATAPAFVAVGTVLFLAGDLPVMGWFAVLCTVVGSVLVAEPWSTGTAHTDFSKGVVLGILAPFSAACYKVMFKCVFDEPPPHIVGVILAWVGAYTVTVGSLLLWIALASGVEYVHWGHVPWHTLLLGNAMSLAFNFLIGWGIAISYPLFISLGTVLTVPLNLVVDSLFRSELPTTTQGCGIVCIMSGFVLLLCSGANSRRREPSQHTAEGSAALTS